MKSVVTFVANHWKELLLVAFMFVLSFIWYGDHKALIDAYDASTEGYEERIEALKESHNREVLKKEDAIMEFRNRVYDLETQHLEYLEELEKLRNRKMEQYITLRKENPDELIIKIEKSFGFEYVD